MTRIAQLALVLFLAGVAGHGGTPERVAADDVTVLRVAMLAPSGSSWMKVLNAWNASLQKHTHNTLKFAFYPGGSQGDERDFIRKMRAGQLDGVAITAVGLSQLLRPILVLTAPGLIVDYDQLDRVRETLGPEFAELFDADGYKLLGWGDAGKVRFFSTQPFERPSDFKKARPWARKEDVMTREFFSVTGANPVLLGVPEVYPALQTNMIDTMPSSAIAAVALQWYTQLKFVTEQNRGIIIGATVIRKDKFEALTPEQQVVLTETGARAHAALNKLVRQDDEKAYATLLKRGVTPIDISPFQTEWSDADAAVRKNLTGRVYSKSLIDQVRAAAGE